MKFRKKMYAIVLVSLALVLVLTDSAVVKAVDEAFYSGNDILFIGEDGGACASGSGSSGGSEPSSLRGEDSHEKVWNYLTDRGLSPVLTAGVMGNLEKESPGMNPWGIEGASYHGGQGFGIVQWTGGRRPPVEAALRAAGITEYTDANYDKGLLVQLNYLWGEVESAYGGWDQFKSETTVGEMSYLESFRETNPKRQYTDVEEMTGKGSLLHFHAKFVISGDQLVPDSGHGKITERMQYGLDFFERFGSGSSDCSIGSGGLTFDQAKALMDWYVDVGAKGDLNLSDACNPLGTFFGECFAWAGFIGHRILGGSCGEGGWSAPGMAHWFIAAPGGATKFKEVTEDTLQPFTVISHGSPNGNQHVMVILGIQDGEIIFTDMNAIGTAMEDTATRYTRGGAGGGPGRVWKVKTLAEAFEVSTPVGPGGEQIETFAAPEDQSAALAAMQAFMTEKGIGGK